MVRGINEIYKKQIIAEGGDSFRDIVIYRF